MKKNKIIEFIKEYGVLLLIIVLPIVLITAMIIFKDPITKKEVHWHMPISYDLCWDTTVLKDSWSHWILHWHDDEQIHIEWIIDTEKRAETLGGFFDSTNIIFSDTQIWKYKNWDKCEWSEKEWKVSVLINGKENKEYRNYILNDKDDIKIMFK